MFILQEMQEDRECAIKKAILDYVLLDDKEQNRLGIPIPPKVCCPCVMLKTKFNFGVCGVKVKVTMTEKKENGFQMITHKQNH